MPISLTSILSHWERRQTNRYASFSLIEPNRIESGRTINLEGRFYPTEPLPANGEHRLKLHLSFDPSKNNFTALGEGYVVVNNDRYVRPIVVTPDEVFTDWNPENVNELNATHFDYLLKLKPEIILFGTGPQQHFPRPELYRALIEARISIEFMNTPAACHTYNILMAESRSVVTAILL